MIKKIIEDIDEGLTVTKAKRPPRGYKHFDNKREQRNIRKQRTTQNRGG